MSTNLNKEIKLVRNARPPLPSEDIRKLHAEVNQLLNQQFLVSTAAIAIFGTFTALMVPKDLDAIKNIQAKHDQLLFVESSGLLIVLFALFAWGNGLSRLVQSISCYLVTTKSSHWEIDYMAFLAKYKPRNTGHLQRVLFGGLGGLATCWPFLISYYVSISVDVSREWPFLLLASLYLAGICTIGTWVYKLDPQTEQKRWLSIVEARDKSSSLEVLVPPVAGCPISVENNKDTAAQEREAESSQPQSA